MKQKTVHVKFRRNEKSPFVGLTAHKEGCMIENKETREQTLAKIEFYLPMLTDEELRIVSGFIKGIQKGRE